MRYTSTGSLLALSLLASLTHAQSYYDGQRPEIGDHSINWQTECSYLSPDTPLPSTPLQCANLEVPLDYVNHSSNDTLSLTLVKVPARREPVLGSIIMNPGGPGGSGVEVAIGRAKDLLTILGDHFNIVSFDPRGVRYTLPFHCFETDVAPPSNLGNSSDVAIGEAFSAGVAQSHNCQQSNSNTSALLSTAYVARDIIRIVDALGEDGLLRYWGLSYGTILGATVASMFPEKVGRLVVDGVANVVEYYYGLEPSALEDLDAVVEGFYSSCSKSPSTCALASDNSTTESIAAKVEDLLLSLKYQPMVVVSDDNSTELLTYTAIKSAMFSALYFPAGWMKLAVALQALTEGDPSGWVTYVGNGTNSERTPYAINGIRCGEASYRTNKLSNLDTFIAEISNVSEFGGLDIGPLNDLICASWLVRANEVYNGTWGVRTKHPVLVIGNTYDPVTPLSSARNMSSLLPGSVLLEHHGYGHTSLAQPSLCTARIMREYFTNGTLPNEGTICEATVPLWSNMTEQEALQPLNPNGTVNGLARREDLNEELLRAMRRLAGAFPGPLY
ncbi:hypothetical protein LTR84_002873 [Exophiala bonariae]|uniref:AB hydrolase-1 domain-containing protein n=1 Tax=Exophiala bonariae TaxID=1690606 RepID=A0AAV9NA88_9EURO|nr:hypothetical protein LTR84_002873 [Exophiala bonariae]